MWVVLHLIMSVLHMRVYCERRLRPTLDIDMTLWSWGCPQNCIVAYRLHLLAVGL